MTATAEATPTKLSVLDGGSRVKPPVSPETLDHRDIEQGEFWRRIPAYRDVDEATFLDYRWQAKKSITKVDKLLATVQDLAPPSPRTRTH